MSMLVAAMQAITVDFDAQAARAWEGACKVGIVQADATPEIRAAVARAAHVADCAAHGTQLAGLAAAFDAGLAVINVETSRAFGHLVETGKLGADLDARLRAAAKTTTAQLDAAEQVRRQFTVAVDHALENVDVLILPTLPALRSEYGRRSMHRSWTDRCRCRSRHVPVRPGTRHSPVRRSRSPRLQYVRSFSCSLILLISAFWSLLVFYCPLCVAPFKRRPGCLFR
jgi:Asp-tRNA(Asn)/Glu-tRNA(Gln) amidotransferase A subunit family amidase